jgi:hypothetical protein
MHGLQAGAGAKRGGIPATIVAHPLREDFVSERSRQIREQGRGGAIADAVSGDAGLPSQRLDDVTLAHATPADKNQIGPAANEIAARQLFDL